MKESEAPKATKNVIDLYTSKNTIRKKTDLSAGKGGTIGGRESGELIRFRMKTMLLLLLLLLLLLIESMLHLLLLLLTLVIGGDGGVESR